MTAPPAGSSPSSPSSRLTDELGADRVGSFAWDVQSDAWIWSAETFRLHGYEPDAVDPSFDLIVGHKVGDGRRRAERALGQVDAPGFRFSNQHRISDTRGRERSVLSVGSASREPAYGGGPDRLVLRGFMVDLSGRHDRVLDAALHHQDEAVAVLSVREREVLLLVASGCSNQEIAASLYVSPNTVKTYLRTAYRKVGVSRRSQAVLWTVANRDSLSKPPAE